MVSIPAVAAQAPNPAYNVEQFRYHSKEDYYTCPQDSKLTSTGKWHQAKTYQFKRYTTKDCKQCPVKDQCTKAKQGKGIQRSEYQCYINLNKERIESNKEYYRKRQAIVEHPYGTIKRQWGFNYIMTKKDKERAEADVGLMFVAYNLRRIFNILDKNTIKEYLKVLTYYFFRIIEVLRIKITRFTKSGFSIKFNTFFIGNPVNQLKLAQISTLNRSF